MLIVKAFKFPQIKMGICQILLLLLFFHRNKLAFTQSRAVSYFFDGSGYALARNIERRGRFSQVTRFDIEVRTPTDNGLILLMINGVSTKSSCYPLSMSATSSPVLTISWKIQNAYVHTFNFQNEEIFCVCLVHVYIRRELELALQRPQEAEALSWTLLSSR